MSLQLRASSGWLRPHQTSREQVRNLLAIADRDLTDSRGGISDDWRFGVAYNAALKLCTVLLYASGCRPEKALAHYRTLQALPLILGESRKADADDLQRFMAALESENPKMWDFFHLLLETGVRKSSLMRMAWVDGNTGKAVWRVAGEETKNGDPLTVPLTDEAVTILRRRFEENRQPRTIAGGKIGAPLRSTWVFPSREIDATDGGHLKDVARSWRAITKRAGLPDLHIHDIRRTLGSWMAAQGSSLLLIGKTLGHRNTKSTEAYARLDVDPVRKAVEQATQAMRNVAKGKQA